MAKSLERVSGAASKALRSFLGNPEEMRALWHNDVCAVTRIDVLYGPTHDRFLFRTLRFYEGDDVLTYGEAARLLRKRRVLVESFGTLYTGDIDFWLQALLGLKKAGALERLAAVSVPGPAP